MNDIDFNYKKILPNTITMMALGFGLSSLNMAYWGRFEMAIIFITLASIFDFMDGKVARFLGVSSKFGEELDSLSDFVCFGVVPGIVMYFWTMDDMKKIEVFQNAVNQSEAVGVHWAVVLFLAMSCATRLARFNAMISEKRPPYWKHFFTGVPAPAGGGIAILPLILWLVTKADIFKSPVLVSCFLIFSGVMMASRLPTFCLKHIRIQIQILL